MRLIPFLIAALLAASARNGFSQSLEQVFATVKRDFEDSSRRRDLVGVRITDRTLERLLPLQDANPALKSEVCNFLQRIAASAEGSDLTFRWRVTAIRLLGEIADHPARTEFLLGLAERSKDLDLEDAERFIERALAGARSRQQVALLAEVATYGKGVSQRLALGGLASLRDDRWFLSLSTRLESFLVIAESPDAELRARAVLLIGQMSGDRGTAALSAATKDGSTIVRLSAAKALRYKLDRPGMIALLGRLLEDPAARVREEAIASYASAPDRTIVPVLVSRMGKEPLRIRAEAAKTLKSLTGLDFGADPAAWKSWLDSARAAGKLDPDLGIPEPVRTAYAASFYGIPILSDRCVFVLDVSGSMEFTAGIQGDSKRLEVAKRELVSTLRALDERTEFSIVTFSSSSRRWKKNALLKATKANIEAAVEFVEDQNGSGATNSFGVLKEVFESFPSIDTIYFLSDGSPTVGATIVQERILAAVERWNLGRGVRIHAVALLSGDAPTPDLAIQDDKDDAARFMAALARETGGSFLRRE